MISMSRKICVGCACPIRLRIRWNNKNMKTINIEYFAILREHAGLDREELQTDAATAAELFAELSGRYSFPELNSVKVAINEEFSDWNAALNEGDVVVYIPPVAGG